MKDRLRVLLLALLGATSIVLPNVGCGAAGFGSNGRLVYAYYKSPFSYREPYAFYVPNLTPGRGDTVSDLVDACMQYRMVGHYNMRLLAGPSAASELPPYDAAAAVQECIDAVNSTIISERDSLKRENKALAAQLEADQEQLREVIDHLAKAGEKGGTASAVCRAEADGTSDSKTASQVSGVTEKVPATVGVRTPAKARPAPKPPAPGGGCPPVTAASAVTVPASIKPAPPAKSPHEGRKSAAAGKPQ